MKHLTNNTINLIRLLSSGDSSSRKLGQAIIKSDKLNFWGFIKKHLIKTFNITRLKGYRGTMCKLNVVLLNDEKISFLTKKKDSRIALRENVHHNIKYFNSIEELLTYYLVKFLEDELSR